MKKILIALTLAAVAASPALAQKNQKKQQQMADNPDYAYAYQAYAWVPTDAGSKAKTEEVWLNGEYLGADPDPFIRSQLLRDPPSHQGGQ
jgi:opacity protein-like surface antigen